MGGKVVKLCDSIVWALWHLLLSDSVDPANLGAFQFLRNVLFKLSQPRLATQTHNL